MPQLRIFAPKNNSNFSILSEISPINVGNRFAIENYCVFLQKFSIEKRYSLYIGIEDFLLNAESMDL